jgi:hypothetical protein
VKFGLVVRADESGLGVQTRALYRMLKPDRIRVINSESSNGRPQHMEWYAAHDPNQRMVIRGFPSRADCAMFLNGLTHVLTCEIPLQLLPVHACRYAGSRPTNSRTLNFSTT